ncbi:conserved hypothetical protein (putative transposase or invertase) [Eubacterium ruminantium]|nr:conserved hypothetical protein (putative transposase or invertase) [Eubacterium ruminantium]
MYDNRQNKNSVFVDLFQNCDDALKNDMELVRWLNILPKDWNGEIKPLHLDDTLYKAFKNDVSFLVGDIILILAEHQSTINPNMPFRALLYISRLLEKFVKVDDRYKNKLAKIPTPAIYVFYNGEKEMPFLHYEKLSDAYLVGDSYISEELKGFSEKYKLGAEYNLQYPLELVVTVININQKINGKDNELLKSCPVLYEYSQLIQLIRDKKKSDSSDYFSEAINECIHLGILADYLSARRSEVYNMLIAEYDYDTDIRVKTEEAREEGFELGIEKGKIEGKIEGKLEGINASRLNYASRKLEKNIDVDDLVSDMIDSFGITEDEAKKIVAEAICNKVEGQDNGREQ